MSASVSTTANDGVSYTSSFALYFIYYSGIVNRRLSCTFVTVNEITLTGIRTQFLTSKITKQ